MKKMVLIPFEQFTKSKEINSSTSVPNITPENAEACVSPKLDRDLVLVPFAKNHLRHASTLLSYVERHMDWNDRGEIIIDDHPIPGSHITDLLKDAMYIHKNFTPVGHSIFYNKLVSVPLTLIRNPTRKYLVGRGLERQNAPPPPGIPIDQQALELSSSNNWTSSWKTI